MLILYLATLLKVFISSERTYAFFLVVFKVVNRYLDFFFYLHPIYFVFLSYCLAKFSNTVLNSREDHSVLFLF